MRCVGGLVALVGWVGCGGQDLPEHAAEASSRTFLSATGTQQVEAAVADTYVEEDQATRNFGAATKLVADQVPERETFLRFSPISVPGRVTRATLRLFAKDGTRDGVRVYRSGSHWEERLVTWDTRPDWLGGALDSEDNLPSGTWVELDLTRAVYGSGEYNFALVGIGNDGADFHSRETPSADLRPQLVLTVEEPPGGCRPQSVPFPGEPLCTYYGTGGGLPLWVRQEGGAGTEQLRALATDTAGGFVAAGHFGGSGEGGFALARFTRDGRRLWSRTVTTGDAEVVDLTVTRAGHILAVGRYQGAPDLGTGPLPPAQAPALFIARFSSSGTTQWARGFEAGHPEGPGRVALPIFPREVATDFEGNLLVSGGFHGAMDLGGGSLFAGLPSVDPLASKTVPGGFLAKFSASGGHRWSKVFPADAPEIATEARSVATDDAGHVLVGVDAYFTGALPDGPVGTARPFIAKYSGTGSPVWRREFTGAHGQLRSVRPLGEHAVAFVANLVLPTTFGGRTYITGSQNWETFIGADPSSYLGTLSATGEDGWLRRLIYSVAEDGQVDGLVTGPDNTLTVYGHGEYLSLLGGGLLRPHNDEGFAVQAPFAARYSREGIHRWSRIFDIDFEGHPTEPRIYVEPLPDGSLLAGSDFTLPVTEEGWTYTSRGSSDLLFLRLRP
ncbi:DNRLRE domain-containing protein [Pyxidicoccus sp. 3LG]